MVIGPLFRTALGKILHAGRIGKAFVLGDRAVDNTPEIGADLVRTTLFSGMTGLTLLEDRFADLGISLLQELSDRRIRLGSRALVTARSRFLGRDDGKTGLFRRL